MRRHFRLAPLLVLISALLLLAPVLASAQTRQMGRSVSLNGTVFSLDYASQFEQAVVRISRAGQSDVWTQTFPAGSSIIADLGILIGSPVADGLYRYEVELTWPGNPQPQVTSGRLKIAGGQIQAGEPKGRKSISPGPTPQADSFVDGNLRVSGAGCFGCPSDTVLIDEDLFALDLYNLNVGGTAVETAYFAPSVAGPLTLWEVGNSLGDFFILSQNGLLALTGDTGQLGLGTINPAGEFHISKPSTNVDLFLERTGTNPSVALFSAQPDSVAFGTLSADPFLIATNNTTRILIGANGGVNVNGDFGVTGIKNFVEDHPTDPTKAIYYASMEGPEAGTYVRGSANLVKGRAVLDLPEHFGLVTADEGLTVQLTPRGEWLQAYVAEVTPHRLVLRARGGKSGRIDYLVIGVRKGYTDYQVIRSKTDGPK